MTSTLLNELGNDVDRLTVFDLDGTAVTGHPSWNGAELVTITADNGDATVFHVLELRVDEALGYRAAFVIAA